jgi:hypothetical protein
MRIKGYNKINRETREGHNKPLRFGFCLFSSGLCQWQSAKAKQKRQNTPKSLSFRLFRAFRG